MNTYKFDYDLTYEYEISYNKIRILNKKNIDNTMIQYLKKINEYNNINTIVVYVWDFCDIYIRTNINNNNVMLIYDNKHYISNNVIIQYIYPTRYHQKININNKSPYICLPIGINIKYLKNFTESYYLTLNIIKNKKSFNNVSSFNTNSCDILYINKQLLYNIHYECSFPIIYYLKFKKEINLNDKKIHFPIYSVINRINNIITKTEYMICMKFYKILDNRYYMYISDILNYNNIFDNDNNIYCCEYQKKIKKNNNLITNIFGVCKCKLIKIYKEYMKIIKDYNCLYINCKEDLPYEFEYINHYIFDCIDIKNISQKSNKSNNLINDINLVDIYKFYN